MSNSKSSLGEDDVSVALVQHAAFTTLAFPA